MRERTTWNREAVLKAAAVSKRAEDPMAMNQDHIQRQHPADAYVTGDPSTFAEDIHPSAKNWKAEYSNGQTSRNEIGMPEMRDDTFNHPETDPGSSPARGGGGSRSASADDEMIVKKADLCCKVARKILGSKATEASLEDQAVALMALSDSDLIATVNRMAQQDEEQAQGQQEQKQAGLPPEFIENMKKKEDGAKDDKKEEKKEAQDQQGQGQAQDEQKQAGQMPDFIKEKIEEKKDDKKEDKEASSRLSSLEALASQLQTMMGQFQQMVQQGPGAQQPVAQEQQLDQMLTEQSNDQMIDQMLQDGQQQGQPQMQMATDFGVELSSASMDIEEHPLTAADDVLNTLFANNPEVQNAQTAYTLQHGAPAPMTVQASAPMQRTASTRTIGTRPTAGVASIGGLGGSASAPSGGDVDKLSSLWNSAPDVSSIFRS